MNDIIRKKDGSRLHFLIYEKYTEEELVLTKSKLLTSLGHRVSVFISEKINNIIHEDLLKLKITPFVLNGDLFETINTIDNFIKINPVDLIFFTRFSPFSFHEFRIYKKFVDRHQVCTLIDSYDRWFKKTPPIKFNGWKIVKRSSFLDWFFCKSMMHSFSCYYVSDPHVNSKNPLKLLLKGKTNKFVFDFPFKYMLNEYNPLVAINETIQFIVPGAIDNLRRDYFTLLKIFDSEEFIDKKWKLILLGRPIGNYGNKVVHYCQEINKKNNKDKIVWMDGYISKTLFGEYMQSSDYILGPILPNKYKYGKDSGVLYDIFLYNKIGVINDKYFYNQNLPERDVIVKYQNPKELRIILSSMIDKSFSYNNMGENLKKINSIFNKKNYLNYLRLNLNRILY
tara:strand:- start:2416 stop:3603 length:1188 start_codon:yes stop_codon:yes gene_type:complete